MCRILAAANVLKFRAWLHAARCWLTDRKWGVAREGCACEQHSAASLAQPHAAVQRRTRDATPRAAVSMLLRGSTNIPRLVTERIVRSVASALHKERSMRHVIEQNGLPS